MSAAIAGGLFATPAYAEGNRTTYVTAWQIQNESSRWTDNQVDSKNTTVTFKNCDVEEDRGSSRRDAHISLRRDVFGPDDHYGQRANPCGGGSSWSVPRGDKGDFYFTLDRINGKRVLGIYLSAKPVYINW
ncbi:hypothetical protein [Streptomyces chattanoogensis]|uniref:hypothetical protein n=1 Tax=Streptomyces chattanoogensis TaxID=66876 RepID=UPI0012FF288B|nr:hypothetical protein [Streptomyces chattanoogensis]